MPEQNQDFPKRRIEKLIFRDELTDAFNRRYLFQYLPEEIRRLKGQKDNLWLFMIDVDDFKTVNDKHGHLTGDAVLKNIADILKVCVRENDTIVRYAGDEFTVVVPSAAVSDVLIVADRIIKTISESKFVSMAGSEIRNVNVSIGIANFPDDAEDTVRLIDLADKALYTSKEAGKNRVSLVGDISADILRGREILERFPCAKLVERNNQWQQLIDAYNKVVSHNVSKCVVITGKAGSGKTRLIEDFAQHVSSQNKLLFMERCSEKSISQPYWNLFNALEKYIQSLKETDRHIFDNISPSQLAVLARGLPAIQKVFGVKAITDNSSFQQHEEEFVLSLVNLLKNISRSDPLFILFDDFHLIDEKTLILFNKLAEEESSIMLCCAFTSFSALPQEEREYPLFKVENSFIKRAVTLELENLSNSGTSEMINIILELDLSDALSALIYKITKGNPLFVEELLKFLIQKGFLYYQKGKWGNIEINESDIPNSLEGVIQERIKSLDKNAQDIISKAAVIGHDFNVDLLHRIGKEDEGYIIDILESAKRAGLIKETVTSYGEELSFVSDEIRKVLYGLMTQDVAKSLHQKLGEIQESIHAGNLDKIAGELFYHFKKAEDHHRATQYIKRIKESEGLFYDRAIKYAKEILEGMEEKKIVPLSKKSTELIPDIIRLIYVINLNMMLYPPRSEMIGRPTEELFRKFSEIFARDETVIFNEVKETLIVNGEKLKGAAIKQMFEESFLSFLRTHGIETLTFKRGLTKPEFSTFIEIIHSPSTDKSTSDLIKSKELFHVEVNDVTYELVDKRAKKKERERLEESMLIDYLLGKITGTGSSQEVDASKRLESSAEEIGNAISRIGKIAEQEGKNKNLIQADIIAKSIQKIGSQVTGKDSHEWQENKKTLAKTIMNLEPRLRKDVLLSMQSSASSGLKSPLEDLIPEFPDEVIVDLLAEEFTTDNTSPAKMKSLIHKFLANPGQRQRILPVLKNKFVRGGLPKEELGWVFGERRWDDFSLEERLNKFLELNVSDYFNLRDEINIKSLVSDIISHEREDFLVKALTKWTGFLNVDSADMGSRIVETTNEILLIIPANRHDALSVFVELICERIKDRDIEIRIYSAILNILTQRMIVFLDKKDFISASIILKAMRNVPAQTEEQEVVLRDGFQEQLNNTSRLRLVVEELVKRVDENLYHNDIVDFISDLGDPVVDLLIDQAMIDEQILSSLGYFGAFLRRRAIGDMLSKIMQHCGSDAVVKKLQTRLTDAKLDIIRNTVELFIYIQDQALAKYLEPVLAHNDLSIKTKLIFVLGKLNGVDGTRLLIKALEDKDLGIRLYAVHALGKAADKSILEDLRKYLQYPDMQFEVQKVIKKIEEKRINV